jgi:nucleoside-specific outer membrane channel protein Tsx
MRTSILRRLSTVALFAAVFAQPALAADPGFATANVQVLRAWNMFDAASPNNADNGDQTTVTFNYFGEHPYGDLNFFVDLSRADAKYYGTNETTAYAEIAPRLLVGKMFGAKIPGLRDFGASFELNQGNDFFAYLAGVGFDLALPQPYLVGASVFYRYDFFVGNTAQFTGVWGIPFTVGPMNFAFKGFIDVTQANDLTDLNDPDAKGIDLMTQPELLVDVGTFFGKPRQFWLGTEYWLHKNPNDDTQALQAMFEWTLR